jgi:hypothetical protein
MNQGVGNESLFVFEFTQHVKDSYLQELTESVNKNRKLSLFGNLKIEITTELYLPVIRNRKCISVNAKFPCSSHGLAIETGIHCQNVIPKEERIWSDLA